MIKFDTYNREERAISAHLFRLLHERLEEKATSPFGQLMSVLSKSSLTFANGKATMAKLKYENIAIYLEPSIIRDAYQSKRAEKISFLDNLTRIIMKQEGVSECRLYSELPETLKNPKLTHPKQIKQKATSANIPLNAGEIKVYGAMQGMFNAKPNLVITVDNLLLVCEAKFTELFDQAQLTRAKKMAEVWATMLYKDFGFTEPPVYAVFKLGAQKSNPDISWTTITQIASKTYGSQDRTRIALEAALEHLTPKPQNGEKKE
jgi:hypothetical protein